MDDNDSAYQYMTANILWLYKKEVYIQWEYVMKILCGVNICL